MRNGNKEAEISLSWQEIFKPLESSSLDNYMLKI